MQLPLPACAVCFGTSDSPLQSGLNMGILTLLIVTGVVFIGFTTFFIQLWRRAPVETDDNTPGSAGHG